MYKNINYILQTSMFVKNALFSCTTLFSTIYCDHKCCLILKNMMVRQGEIPPKYHSGEKKMPHKIF